MEGSGGGPDDAPHPLAGVLDRLLSRERGQPSPQPVVSPVHPAPPEPARARRVVVIAALGPDRGAEALLALARWGTRAGRRVGVLDLAAGGVSAGAVPAAAADDEASSVPVVRLVGGTEALSRESPAAVRAVLDRLRRHELTADLLLVRMAVEDRAALCRGAFLAGTVVVPVGRGDRWLHDAFCLSRDLLDAFAGVSLLPYSGDASALDLYAAMLRDFAGARAEALDLEDETGPAIDRLPASPREGFVAALFEADAPPAPTAGLLVIERMRI